MAHKSLRNTAGYAWNIISLIGLILALTSTCILILLLSFELINGLENPYIGLMTYFLFPGMLIFGLLLVPIGAYRVRNQRRLHREEDIPPYPILDLNEPHRRHLLLFFVASSIIFVLIVAIATIKGYEFTESTAFCGKLCHQVMEPEHTAWGNSPHAKVKCVECHVGPGAKWYVKAKITGLGQVWAVLNNSYTRPIETPIENLRPARDTCEQCHWPEKFHSAIQKGFYHYAPNETNTSRETYLLIKIGGTPKNATAKGIHWHINSEVTYIATDKKRLNIPYIQVKDKNGNITDYLSIENPLSKKEITKGNKRLMDCIDCHNRPAHIYRSPAQEIDENLLAGHIDQHLPYIKKVALDLLEKPYMTVTEANKAIASGIQDYYLQNYPELLKTKEAAIKKAIVEIQNSYRKNFFPLMKVSWKTYPNNIGHFYTPGCFRCHDGKHKSASGKIISKDCNLCHIVLGQKQENIPAGTKVTEFIHPFNIGDELFKTNCSDCHNEGGDNNQDGNVSGDAPAKSHGH